MSRADSADRTVTSPRRWPAVVSIALAALAFAALLYYPIRESREAATRSACKNNLRQIGLALHAYHEQYSSFPPAYAVDAAGRRMHSWRVLILPYLGENALYSQYRFDEPWDGPHNREMAARMPAVFGCPRHGKSAAGVTDYLAVVGPETVWPEQYAAYAGQVLDGTSITIQVIERADSDVVWLEPRDVSFREAKETPLRATHPRGSSSGVQHVLFADGSVRAISTHIEPKTYRYLLTARSGMPIPGIDWPVELTVGQYDFDVPVSSDELQVTDIVPYTAGPITNGRSYVYCATFQLAWDDFRRVVGGDPIRLDGDPPLAAAMNAESFPRTALSEDSFVARGGMMRDGILDQILQEMQSKFPNAQPQLMEYRPTEKAVVMYAYLLKVLPFQEKFDRLSEPLQFKTADGENAVAAFGLPETPRDIIQEKVVRDQLTVLDYRNDDDFILRINTARKRDEIVLAKIPPAATLADTLRSVQHRIEQPASTHNRRACETGEVLAIPVLTLNVRRTFKEILECNILNPGLGDTLWVERAAQIIRFHLDENGAHLEAEAEVIGEDGWSEAVPVPKPRRFIFDRPFLLLLQERDAPVPYFAAWIANTELMERVNTPPAGR